MWMKFLRFGLFRRSLVYEGYPNVVWLRNLVEGPSSLTHSRIEEYLVIAGFPLSIFSIKRPFYHISLPFYICIAFSWRTQGQIKFLMGFFTPLILSYVEKAEKSFIFYSVCCPLLQYFEIIFTLITFLSKTSAYDLQALDRPSEIVSLDL